jgi:hypothetical protein
MESQAVLSEESSIAEGDKDGRETGKGLLLRLRLRREGFITGWHYTDGIPPKFENVTTPNSGNLSMMNRLISCLQSNTVHASNWWNKLSDRIMFTEQN